MNPQTPDVNADDADNIEPEEATTPPPSSSKQPASGAAAKPSTSTGDDQRPDPTAIASTSNHNGDSTANNNNTARKAMNNHHNMANENNADAGTSTMGAPSRASGSQSHTNQMIGINGSVGTHSSYHTQNQTGHHFASNNNNNGGGASVGHHQLRNTDSDDEDFVSAGVLAGGGVAAGAVGTWGQARSSNSRAVSPSLNDNMSENSSQAPTMMPGQMVRSKSRPEIIAPSSRYNNTSFWKARRVLFYRNGDPYFPGVEYRFKPTRDISTLEALLEKITPKIDLPRGARYVFSMDGDRKYSLDELEDGASYVLSSFKLFKVSRVPSFSQFHFCATWIINCVTNNVWALGIADV